MYAGEIVEEGQSTEILNNPQHPYTASLIKCVPQLGERNAELYSIKGSPPLLDNLPHGCKFAARCESVKSKCKENNISLKTSTKRAVRCLYPLRIS